VLIELQSHSTVSDGQLGPAGVVEEAAKVGVTTLALSDHDAIAGVAEAAAAAEAAGIDFVPAVEMSCVHEYADDLHVCGYWIDLGGTASLARAGRERVTRAPPGQLPQARLHVAPGAHVARLFLQPDQLLRIRVLLEDGANGRMLERRELLTEESSKFLFPHVDYDVYALDGGPSHADRYLPLIDARLLTDNDWARAEAVMRRAAEIRRAFYDQFS